MPKTAASCCNSSIDNCETELRALAWKCRLVSAQITAPSSFKPATLSLTPMNDPFRFRPAAAISDGWRKVRPQYIPASKFRACEGPQSCMRLSTLQGETLQRRLVPRHPVDRAKLTELSCCR